MLCIGLVATVVCIGLFTAIKHPGVDNDLTQVLTVARNIAAGDGIVTDTIYYEQHHMFDKVPAPQTVFPPGQPIAVATLLRLGFGEMTATRIVAAAGFLVLPVFLLLLCIRAGLPKATAFIVAVFWLCVVLAWYNLVNRKSDVPFIALTMLSASWLARDRGSRILNSSIAGVVAGFALTIRYAGLFFMLAVGIWLLLEWLRERSFKRFATLIGFCIPAGATACMFFYRNYQLVGDIKGGNNYAEPKSVIDIIRGIYLEHTRITGFDYDRLKVGSVAEVCLVLVVLFGAFLCFRRGVRQIVVDVVTVLRENRVALFCVIYFAVTYVMLVFLEINSQPGARHRMYMAATPFIFCLVGCLMQRTSRAPATRGFQVWLAGLLVTFLIGQANVAQHFFGTFRHGHHWYNLVRVMDRPMGETTVGAFLREKVTREHPLMTNEPQRMGEILKRPVVGLPSPLYSATTWNDENAREVAERFNVRYLLVLTDENSLSFEEFDYFKTPRESN